jgi:hypothetical protein
MEAAIIHEFVIFCLARHDFHHAAMPHRGNAHQINGSIAPATRLNQRASRMGPACVPGYKSIVVQYGPAKAEACIPIQQMV